MNSDELPSPPAVASSPNDLPRPPPGSYPPSVPPPLQQQQQPAANGDNLPPPPSPPEAGPYPDSQQGTSHGTNNPDNSTGPMPPGPTGLVPVIAPISPFTSTTGVGPALQTANAAVRNGGPLLAGYLGIFGAALLL